MGTKGGHMGRRIGIGAVVVVLVACGAYAVRGMWSGPRIDPNDVIGSISRIDNEQFAENADLQAKAREALHNQPRHEMFQRFHDQNLSDEDRERLRENMRTLMTEEMDARVEEYEKAPEDQKKAILDQHIDEMVARREQWQRERAQRGDRGGPNGEERRTGPDGAGGPGGPGDRGVRGDQPGGGEGNRAAAGGNGNNQRGFNRRRPSIEQRKTRMEGSSPDRSARMRQYFNKLHQRAQERGVNLGWGGRGGGRRGGR